MVRRLILSLALVLSSVLQFAHAQAFGIAMGAKPTSIPGAKEVESNEPAIKTFSLTSAPLPHSEFERYMVLATDSQGICKVVGIGKDHKNDNAGYSIRTAFDEMRNALATKYGVGTKFDFLHSGSIWRETDEFVMAIKLGQRTLANMWTRTNNSELPASIVAISLEVEATDSSSTYVSLAYEFANFAECTAENRRGNSEGL